MDNRTFALHKIRCPAFCKGCCEFLFSTDGSKSVWAPANWLHPKSRLERTEVEEQMKLLMTVLV